MAGGMRDNTAVRDNAALSRFELDDGDVTVVLNYRRTGNTISFDHTETPVAARGRGLASRLVRGALQAARTQGLKVVPRCGFVRDYLAKHPEFGDLLAQP